MAETMSDEQANGIKIDHQNNLKTVAVITFNKIEPLNMVCMFRLTKTAYQFCILKGKIGKEFVFLLSVLTSLYAEKSTMRSVLTG